MMSASLYVLFSVVLIFTAVKKLKPCGIHFNFVDFCHDSAKYASIMALAAPKVHQYFTLIFVLIKGAGADGPFSQTRSLFPCTTINHAQYILGQGH